MFVSHKKPTKWKLEKKKARSLIFWVFDYPASIFTFKIFKKSSGVFLKEQEKYNQKRIFLCIEFFNIFWNFLDKKKAVFLMFSLVLF